MDNRKWETWGVIVSDSEIQRDEQRVDFKHHAAFL